MALRRLFPNFDEELLKRDGRIGDADLFAHTCAGRFFRSPKIWYPSGRTPEMFVCSRDAYERLLRHLVVNSSSRIRRVAGTVTGLKAYENNPKEIKSVMVSLTSSSGGGGKLSEISAALVVGKPFEI